MGRNRTSVLRVATKRNEIGLTKSLNGGHRQEYASFMPAKVTSRIAWRSEAQKKWARQHAKKVSGDLSSYVQEHFEREREKQGRLAS